MEVSHDEMEEQGGSLRAHIEILQYQTLLDTKIRCAIFSAASRLILIHVDLLYDYVLWVKSWL